MIVKPRQLGGPGPLGAVAPWEEEEEEEEEDQYRATFYRTSAI
jgi:hypothetical protein